MKNKWKEKSNVIVGSLLFLVSIAFILIGIMNGQEMEVLRKAVRICLECIGIG